MQLRAATVAARALEGMAQVAIERARHEYAAQLFGAAEAAREMVPAPVPPSQARFSRMRSFRDRHVERREATIALSLETTPESFMPALLQPRVHASMGRHSAGRSSGERQVKLT